MTLNETWDKVRYVFAALFVSFALLHPMSSLAQQELCAQMAVAAVEGAPDYQVASCCYKGCGGACCRCGTAYGFQPGCSSPCAIGRVDELKTMKALAVRQGIVVSGRLVHATTKAPLSGEDVSLMLPGGAMATAKSQADGKFVLRIKGEGAPKRTEVGDLPSTPSTELGKDESKVYQLFIVPKTFPKVAS